MVQVLERDPLLLRTYSSSNILLIMSSEYLIHHRYGLQLMPHDQYVFLVKCGILLQNCVDKTHRERL